MRYSIAVALAGFLALLVGFSAHAQERDLEAILRFEEPQQGETLHGWNGAPQETIHFDSTVVRSGRGAARIERGADSPNAFTAINVGLPIDFGGEWIELRGYLRTQDVAEHAGLWMREDGAGGSVQFDNMYGQGPTGTTDWTEYTIRLPLDPAARQLVVGVLVAGEGTVWADDLELFVDGKPIAEAPERVVEPTVLDTDNEFDDGSGITISSLSERQTANLAVLGRVWGFLKYHHPRVASGEVHWDYELFRVVPDILNAADASTRNSIVSAWVAQLGVPEACNPCAESAENVHLHSQVDWIRDAELLGEDLSRQLQHIYANRFAGDEQFYVRPAPGVGNPVFQNEPAYAEQQPPDAGYRLLALYRLWNMIEYWFPYRDQLDDDWNAVLHTFLPRITQAESWDDYRLELLALITRIQDTHANLWAALDVRPPRGDCSWPVALRYVEDRPTVTAFLQDVAGGFEIGDAVLAVDGQPVDSLFEAWAPYYSASNETVRRRDMARYLPRGPCRESEVTIDRRGQMQTLAVQRVEGVERQNVPHDRPGETFQLLSPDVAYLKLSSIKSDDSDAYIEQAQGTRGMIIDIRNYPSEFVVFALGTRLIDEPTPFTRFTVGDIDNPGTFTWTEPLVLQPQEPGYDGQVVVLVDESSISQAEYTAMAFRAGREAVVVGSTTAGADGNVSPISLPGGLRTMISGIGVFYPDKMPTQRIGIVPDVEVRPTAEGIREGRDEVLEAALRHILGPGLDSDAIREIATPE